MEDAARPSWPLDSTVWCLSSPWERVGWPVGIGLLLPRVASSDPCQPAAFSATGPAKDLEPTSGPHRRQPRAASSAISSIMALRELPLRTVSALCRDVRPAVHTLQPSSRRHASSSALAHVEDSSSFSVPPPSDELAKGFDPVARSRLRRRGKRELPSSRYNTLEGLPETTS